MPAPLASVTREHERLVHAAARPVGLDQPAVVDDPVDHRRGEPVVAEDRAPPPELDVGRDDETPPLAAVRHHLEQQPRTVELALGARPLEPRHQARRRVEPHRATHRDGPHAHRRREVGLAPPGPAVEHEAPGGVQEVGRLEVGRPAAVAEGHPRAVVPHGAPPVAGAGVAEPVLEPVVGAAGPEGPGGADPVARAPADPGRVVEDDPGGDAADELEDVPGALAHALRVLAGEHLREPDV